jgi:hypothetical protein
MQKILNAFRHFNKVKRLTRQFEYPLAATLATAATDVARVEEATGINRVVAASVGNPLVTEEVRAIDGALPDSLSSSFRQHMDNIDEHIEEASRVMGTEFVVDKVDQAYLAAEWAKKFAKTPNVENVKATFGPDKRTLTIETYDGDGNLIENYEGLDFILDAHGSYFQKDTGKLISGVPLAEHVVSPNIIQGTDAEHLVNLLTSLGFARSKMKNFLNKGFNQAVKPIRFNKKSLKNVNDMLLRMDGTDHNEDYHTLVVTGVGGQRLTDKEFLAYMGVRKMYDHLHLLENSAEARRWELEGISAFKTANEREISGKWYQEADSAKKVYNADHENKYVYIPDQAPGYVSKLTSEEIDEFYSNGYVLVNANRASEYDWFSNGDRFMKYALVKREDNLGIPEDIIPYRKNYTPKLRQDGNYFLKVKENKKVNDSNREVWRTISYGHTPSQLERYARDVEDVRVKYGEDPKPDDNYRIFLDKELKEETLRDDAISASGGLFRGSRSTRTIEFAGDRSSEGKLVDALDIIQRALASTADRVTMSEWRAVQREKWLKSAELVDPEVRRVSFQRAVGLIAESNIREGIKKKLLDAHKQIEFASGMTTMSEQKFQGMIRSLGNYIDSKGGEKIAKYLYRIQDNSPIDLMKSYAYHTSLGAFSLVQIPLQIAGATVALSVSPQHAPKALERWLTASVLDLSSDWTSNKKVIQLLNDRMGWDVTAKDYEFWRRSGMREGVNQTNSDIASIINNLPYDAGVLRRIANKALAVGELPYKFGELGNMRISFFTALEEAKAQKGANFTYSDSDLRDVIARTEDFRLQMGQFNKASFQRGLLSVPAQFKQIFIKYPEALANKRFTKAERIRIGLAQAVLWGSAGIPIFNIYSDHVLSWFVDPEDPNPDALALAKRGLGGYGVQLLGGDADIAGRLTVSADLIQEMSNMLTEERSLIEVAGGVFSSSGLKAYDAITSAVMAGRVLYNSQMTKQDFYLFMDQVQAATLGLTSSGKRYIEGLLLQESGVIKVGSSALRANPEDREEIDIFLRKIGFGSAKLNDYYKFKKAVRDVEETNNALADAYSNAFRNTILFSTSDGSNEATLRLYHGLLADLNREISSLPFKEQVRINNRFRNNLNTIANYEDKIFWKYLETLGSPEAPSAISTSVLGAEMLEKSRNKEAEE